MSNLRVFPEEMASFIKREKDTIKEENEADELINKAAFFLDTQRPRKTIKVVNEVLKKYKNNDLALLIKGEALVLLGEFKKAEEIFKKCETI